MSFSASGPRAVRSPSCGPRGPAVYSVSSSPLAASPYPTYAAPPTQQGPTRMLSSSAQAWPSEARLAALPAASPTTGLSACVEPLAPLRMLSSTASMERLAPASAASTERLVSSSRVVANGVRQMPVTLSGSPPPTVEVFGQPPPTMVFSQPPPMMTYAAAPQVVQRSPAQRIEAVEVRGSGPCVREVIEVVRDDAEVFSLRMQLEEKAILVVEYQRRNTELQAQKNQYERLLAEAEGQMSQLRTERVTLLNVIEDNQAKITQLQAEIAALLARNEELVALNAGQAQRIAALDSLVIDLELKNSQQQTEISALRKCNRELEQLAEQQAAKIAELERLVEDLRRQQASSPPPSPPAAGGLSMTIRWRLPDGSQQDTTFTRVPMGFELEQDSEPATTEDVVLGGHADSLGVGIGWQVMGVNSQSVEGWTYKEVTKLIIGNARAVNPNASMTTKRRSTSGSSNGALRQSR